MNALIHRLYNHLFGELMLLCITHFYIKIADNFNLTATDSDPCWRMCWLSNVMQHCIEVFIKEWFYIVSVFAGGQQGTVQPFSDEDASIETLSHCSSLSERTSAAEEGGNLWSHLFITIQCNANAWISSCVELKLRKQQHLTSSHPVWQLVKLKKWLKRTSSTNWRCT